MYFNVFLKEPEAMEKMGMGEIGCQSPGVSL